MSHYLHVEVLRRPVDSALYTQGTRDTTAATVSGTRWDTRDATAVKAPVLVLALVEDGQPPPPGVRVLYRFQATSGDMADTGRQARDVVAAARQSDQVAPLYTLAEVAGILRCDPRTVQRMVADGLLAAVKVGRSYRVEPGALAAFLAEHRQSVNGAA
jgi:excisionase family DNA binding protein